MKGARRGRKKKEGPLGEVQIESEGPPILSSCSSKVQLLGGADEMIGKSPVSVQERHEEVAILDLFRDNKQSVKGVK